MTDLIAEPARTIHSGVLGESGWVVPIDEIKKAAEVAAKYNVSIFLPHKLEPNYKLPAVFMYDAEKFFALDGYEDYCIGGFDWGTEDDPAFWVYPRKTIGGIHFYCKVDYDEYEAEIDKIKRRRD